MTINGKNKTLLLIDSHALIYRAYFAMPPNLTTRKGEPVNAVFGFTSILLDVLLKFKPSNVVAVMDSKEATFRKEMFSEYKANRKEPEELFIAQLPRVEEVLKALDIPLLKVAGFEADDIIATIDDKHSGAWAQTIIVTGDRDLFQLVDEDTFVYLAGGKFSESKLYDEKGVEQKMGIKPSEIVDLKAIAGDASDNIPGVKGIGGKGAANLVGKFGSVENVYENLDKVETRYRDKLSESYEIALLSKRLATVDRDVPVSFDFSTSKFDTFDYFEADSLLDELEFKSLKSKLKKLAEEAGLPTHSEVQLGLLHQHSASDLAHEKWTKDRGIKSKTIYLLPLVEDANASSANMKLKKLLFLDGDNEATVWEVGDDELNHFKSGIKGLTLVGFDFKKLFASNFLDKKIFSDESKFEDLGIISCIISSGNASNTLQGVLKHFELEYSDEKGTNLIALRAAYQKYLEETERNSWAKRVISIEKRILPLVVEMEQKGIMLDVDMINKFEQDMTKLKNSLKEMIYQSCGHEFNINSPKQVAEVLFAEKKLPGGRKTKTGSYSTNESELKKLKSVDPIIDNLLKYREVDKLLSTYLKALPGYVDNLTKRVHSTFDQLGAISGRFSSKNPNLQNIPTPEGFEINLRSAFKASEDCIFVAFDYSQQELRILAALSGEEKMIEKFNKDEDIHVATASELFNVPPNKVTKAQRSIGKTVNFSVVYGISSFGLSERLEISRAEAGMFIQKYFEEYPKVKKYFGSLLSNAREKGYVETILGRRRDMSLLNSNNHILRQNVEREGINFPMQGSAADVMKMAMAELPKILKKYPASLLLQIHDEFLFEFQTKKINSPKDDQNLVNFIKEVKELMTNIYDIGVSYKVDAKIGVRWGEMKEFL